MKFATSMRCPECESEMTLAGSFWVCGQHTQPIFLPAEETKEEASPDSFRHLVDSLPTPIALLIEEYLKESVPFIKLHRITDAAELITRFFAIVLLSDIYQQLGDFPKEVKRTLADCLERPSFGVWRSIADIALGSWENIPKKQRQPFFILELLDFWKTHWKPLLGDNEGNPEREIIPLRNNLAHAGRLPDTRAAELLELHKTRFEDVLLQLDFLTNYRLLSILKASEAPVLLRGLPNFNTWSLPSLSTGEYPDSLEPQRVYLLKNKEVLSLFPLHSYNAVMLWREEEQAFREVDRPAPMLYLRYNEQRQRLEFTALASKTSFAQQDENFRQMFCAVFKLSEWRSHQEEQDDRQSELKRWKYDFSDILPQLTQGLVGRQEQLQQAKDWVKSHQSQGGILWISGKPGVGKSAFVAKLTTNLKGNSKLCVVPFFFKSGDARCSPDRFFQAAILQLSEKFRLSIQIEPNEPLSVQFAKVLEALRQKHSEESPALPVVFLLDGLDEVAFGHPDYVRLPLSYQYPGMIWVCAGRGEPPLSEVFAVDEVERIWQDGELPPLTDKDVRQLIEQECDRLRYELFQRDEKSETGDYRNPFIEELVKRSEGLPLYVRLAIEDLQTGRFSFADENKLPEGLRDYFEEILGRLKVGDIPQMLTDVLTILIWAAEPLTEEMFREVVRSLYAYTEDWERVLADALSYGHIMLTRRVTPEGGCGWTLYHESFRQHLHDTPTIKNARQRAHNLLLDWCGRWQEHKHPYSLRHYAEHLQVAQRYEELYALARNQAFLRMQADVLIDEPNAPLRTLQTALSAAMVQDDAAKMAEFCLTHARRLIKIIQESPLDALRGDNLERAWKLADLYEIERCILWYLLLAWALKDMGRLDKAQETLQRLQQKPLLRLSSWQGYSAAYLLVYVSNLSEDTFTFLHQSLLDDYARHDLCEHLSACGYFANALHTAQQIDDKRRRAGALTEVASALAEAGNTKAAESTFANALYTAQQIDDKWRRAEALTQIALALAEAGNTEAAELTFANALHTAQQIDKKGQRAEALMKIVSALAKMGNTEAALHTAQQIDDKWRQVRALMKIISALAKVGNTEAALHTAQQIDDKWQRAEALTKIALALAEAGNTEAAELTFANALHTAQQIDDKWQRAEALTEIALALAKSGNHEAALHTARQIDHESLWAEALTEIAPALAEVGNTEAALNTAQQIDDKRQRAEALTKIALALAKSGNHEAVESTFANALQTAQQIDHEYLWAEVLTEIALALALAGNTKAAELTFANALHTTQQIDDKWQQARTLTKIALALAKSGNHEAVESTFANALQAAQQIDDKRQRARALTEITLALAKSGNHEAVESTFANALQAAQQIDDKRQRARTLTEIISALAKSGNHEAVKFIFANALQAAQQIDNEWLRAEALTEIASALAKSGNTEAALQTAQHIDEDLLLTRALTEIASALAKSGNTEAALQTAQQIDNEWLRAQALTEIASALAKSGNTEAALQTAQHIDEDLLLTRALTEIASALAKSGNTEAALQTAQQIDNEWLRAQALTEIASALAKSGNTEAALQTAQQINNESEQAMELTEITSALAEVGNTEAAESTFTNALNTAQHIDDKWQQAIELAKIASAQIQAGFGQQAVKTAETILADRNWHFLKIATTFIETGDKVNFKQLLIPCAYYLDAAYKMCGLLAQLYPEQAAAIADGVIRLP